MMNGGETGIRTLGGLSPTTVFETAAFDHSATSPRQGSSWSGDLAVSGAVRNRILRIGAEIRGGFGDGALAGGEGLPGGGGTGAPASVSATGPALRPGPAPVPKLAPATAPRPRAPGDRRCQGAGQGAA